MFLEGIGAGSYSKGIHRFVIVLKLNLLKKTRGWKSLLTLKVCLVLLVQWRSLNKKIGTNGAAVSSHLSGGIKMSAHNVHSDCQMY